MHILKPPVPTTAKSLHTLFKNAFVLDIETTIAEDPLPPGCQFAASPHNDDNFVVAAGIARPSLITGQSVHSDKYYSALTFHQETYFETYFKGGNLGASLAKHILDSKTTDSEGILFVGHNIAFDLMHLDTQKGRQATSTISIWDTMLAEKYLNNQKTGLKLSLEDCCERYGIDFEKNETVTDSFNLGIGSDKIHPGTLMTYLYHDVRATDQLFKAQHDLAMQRGGVCYVRYLLGLMSARLTTLRMELCGMHLSLHQFNLNKSNQQIEMKTYETKLQAKMLSKFPKNTKAEVTPASAKQIKTYLFGGIVDCVVDAPITDKEGNCLKYKSGTRKGQLKTKKEILKVNVPSAVVNVPKTIDQSKADDKTLNDLLTHYKKKLGTAVSNSTIEFIEDLLAYRTLAKNYSTYYEGMAKHIWTDKDSCIHPQYNHAVAVTKRLTSSKPNMQNISNKGEDSS